jgi:hypothetical protein
MIWQILLAIITICSIYVNWNLFRKIERLEDANEELSDWIGSFESEINNILTTIKTLDSKDMFEKDDDIGTVYTQISNTIKKLEEYVDEN